MNGDFTAFGVLSMPVNDLASKQAIRAAGCTHTVISASWADLQPNGPGTALDPTQVQYLINDFGYAADAGLKVMFEAAIQYAPSWVLSGAEAVEQFADQDGNVYDGAAAASGQQVANWMWTALGWLYVSDFITRLGAALGDCVAQTSEVKIGGGWYGELHYAPSAITSSPYSFWGYGTSMQTGAGLAAGQAVCPLPGYTIFSGTDAQDSLWLNWYLDGLGTWLLWLAGQMRAAGWTCDYHVCHPGYGVRSNQTHSQSGYRQAASLGEDPARMIGVYSHDPQIWPYCTWLDTADGYDPSAVDSDISAWKKVYEEAYARNKHYKLWGENTGGESTSGMDNIFSGDEYGSALSGATYNLAPAQTYGFQGIFWLDYAALTGGIAGNASLSDYAAAIASHVPTL